MSLIRLVRLEHDIRAVQPVQDPQHTVAVVELEMMEVMSFGRRTEGKMIARVGVESVGRGKEEPERVHGDVRTHEKRSHG